MYIQDVEQKTATEKTIAHVEHHNHDGYTLGAHGPGGISHVFQESSSGKVAGKLLLPRPTEDPRDPLTWSLWRKHLAFFSISFFVFLSNYITATVTPILLPIIEDFDVSLTKGTYLITFNILFLGIGNLFWIPLSLKIGKRPVLIMSAVLFFASSVWAAVAQSWGSLFGARIVQGFSASSSEALGPAIVADLYFLHERGGKVGFYTFMIAGGSALGGIFAGQIANATTSWRWVFWMNVILTGVCCLLTVLFQAETNFQRPLEYESGEGLESSRLAEMRKNARPSWARSLGLTSWYNREQSIWSLWWRPFLTLRYPAVVWASLTYGVTLGWVVLQQTANAGAFPELYGFSGRDVGNINAANLIGAVIGCLAGGPLTDIVVAAISKRHGGYFEPEFRLWCLIAPFIFGPIGIMLWGCGLGKHLTSLVPIAGAGITYGVLCAVPAIAFKNTFAFGLSFAVVPWIEKSGYVKLAGWMTLIEGLIFFTTIPIYMYASDCVGDRRFNAWKESVGDPTAKFRRLCVSTQCDYLTTLFSESHSNKA